MAFMDPPASVSSDGTRRGVWIEGGVANINAITIAEILSGTDVSCYLTVPGWDPSEDQATITDSRRCTSTDIQVPGRKSASPTLEYTFNLDEPTEDVARLALTERSTGVFVDILQKPEEDEDIAVGDWYRAFPLKLGAQVPSASATNALDRINQKAFLVGPVSEISQVVAGS